MAVEVLLIDEGVVCREQDSAAGAAGFDGVHRRFRFTFVRDGTGGVEGVGSVSNELRLGDGIGGHVFPLRLYFRMREGGDWIKVRGFGRVR